MRSVLGLGIRSIKEKAVIGSGLVLQHPSLSIWNNLKSQRNLGDDDFTCLLTKPPSVMPTS
ncbi:hypothetical protein MIZ03_1078 [Rhodoferax lithotrophicus]|uniref:Uncharacterized protein n=1 Tax=Rhodoferax lithotrophicus TaxID=2798804 RepID=A0ABN6D8E1_9BURK|nr:hypothetical protein MIZ03_1078 [Rhodoferax sp. MIZ03]